MSNNCFVFMVSGIERYFNKNCAGVFVLLFVPLLLFCQKPAQLKSEGEAAFSDGRWSTALDLLSQYQEQKPGDIGVLTKIGRAAYYLHQPDKAKQYLEYVTSSGRSADPDTWFSFARTLHGLQEWERAIEAYKQYLRLASESHLFRANARDNIRRCVSGMSTKPNDNVALVENMGDQVNSAYDEFAPLPSFNHPDRLYYSSARPASVGGMRNDEGYADEKTGHWCSDMYVSKRSNRGWEAPETFSTLQNTARFEVALDFTSNGQVLCFSRGFTLYSGEVLTDTANLKDEYRSEASAFRSAMQPEAGDLSPFFFKDTVLLFGSRRAGGFGGLDLWVSVYTNGQWSEAANLGSAINSAYDETSPFVAADGKTLYFSSNRTESIGGLDIWKTVYDIVNRSWAAPVHLGNGINSPGDDESFRLSADGKTATFASDRITDNFGGRDLYMAYFKEELAEQLPVEAASFALYDPATKKAQKNTIEEIKFEALFYTNERDLLSAANLKTLARMAAVAKQYPSVQWILTAHTDETGPLKFDLFNGIKRAEQIGKYLTDKGIANAQILLRSAGSAFPYARNIQNGSPSPIGQGLNRRIDIGIAPPATQSAPAFNFLLERPVVSDALAAAGTSRLDEQNLGLLYRVEFATTRQVLTSDALGMFSDIVLETEPGSGSYRYLTAATRQYTQAAALKKDLIAQGFKDPVVVPYINGWPLQRAAAIGLIKKYPDLATYVKSE